MIRRIVIITGILIFLLLAAVFIEAARQPRQYRWETTYSSYDKEPYGAYVFFDQLPHFFPGYMVKRLGNEDLADYQVYDPLYYSIGDEVYYEGDTSLVLPELGEYKEFNFIGLNEEFYLSDPDARSLLIHLYQGNEALIVAQELTGNLLHYMGVRTEVEDLGTKKTEEKARAYTLLLPDSTTVAYKGFDLYTRIVSMPDSASVVATTILGDTVGIRVKIGKGALTYFSLPILFSNYHLLKSDRRLVSSLLTALPNRDTYWANFFTGTRNYPESRSLLDFIHSQEALTWAFYVLLFAVVLYFGSRIRREQRAVPLVAPPQNESLKFVNSISNLYLLKKDHRELIMKKMIFFQERVRAVYHLDTNRVDESFFKKLSVKSGIEEAKIRELFRQYDRLVNKDHLSDEDFMRFNQLLQNFKQL